MSQSDYKPRISIKSDAFMEAFQEYQLGTNEKHADISKFLSEKRYPIKDVDATYRVINHWDSVGLLDDARETDSIGWRKFSLVDLVWIRVLRELRLYGLPLDKLQKTYRSAFFFPESNKKRWKLFEFGVCGCLLRNSMVAVIFSDGILEILPREVLSINEDFGLMKENSCLVLDLNRCLQQIFPKTDFSPKNSTRFSLKDKEIKTLQAVFNEKTDEITIIKKNGSIDRIETKQKHLGNTERLIDLLQGAYYGEIKIKKENGKVIFAEVTNKEKI